MKHMGQQHLGRYPVHFHLCGDVDSKGGYRHPASVDGLSIHHSFSRCITVHGTNGLLVSSLTLCWRGTVIEMLGLLTLTTPPFYTSKLLTTGCASTCSYWRICLSICRSLVFSERTSIVLYDHFLRKPQVVCVQWHYAPIFLQIKDTIGFDALGHCFFLEDGVEQRNILFHNLGLLTKPGTLLPTDRNSSMCTIMRDGVFGNYMPVPTTDCMWVITGQGVGWWSSPLTFRGTLAGEILRGRVSVKNVSVTFDNALQGRFNFLDCPPQQPSDQ